MKKFIIERIDKEGKVLDTFEVNNLTDFCRRNNLTLRLLNYTHTGERNHHKHFRIKMKTGSEKDNQKYNKKQDTYDVIEKELYKEKKKNQRLQDSLTTYRMYGRETNRWLTFLDDAIKLFGDKIKKDNPKYIPSIIHNNDTELILCLSDLHIGQRVEVSNNKFNIEIANRRLEKLFNETMKEMELRKCSTITFAMLGDLIHAQCVYKKADMKLSAEFSEVESTINAFRLLYKYIDKFVEKYKVNFMGVCGNESRFASYTNPSNLDSEFSNSMDYMIYNLFKTRYENNVNVKFLNESKLIEEVVEVNGYNFCLVHGHNLKHGNLSDSIKNLKLRMMESGYRVDYTLLGHIHQTYITDDFARNASLVGSNSYSNSLNISGGKSSQNLIVVNRDGIKAFSIRLS